jgi:hypothetical protein
MWTVPDAEVVPALFLAGSLNWMPVTVDPLIWFAPDP